MRGLYNGEIRDRPHLLELLLFPLALFFVTGLPFYIAYKSLFSQDELHLLKGLISLGVGLILLWMILILYGRELIFLRINKKRISVKRPLLRLSPFKKDRVFIEISISEIGEINITRRGRGPLTWRIISKDQEQILKFLFEPEYLFLTVELDDYFQENGIEIKLTKYS